MVRAWVLPDHEDRVRTLEIFKQDSPFANPNCLLQRDATCFMAHIRAVGEVVRSIARDGKMLYERGAHSLAQPKPLTTEEVKEEAQRYFEQWLPDAIALEDGAMFYLHGGHPNLAAFTLHQATERLYHCLLLTLTLYSPKSHRIKVLRSKAEDLDKRLVAVWPRDNRMARRRFELLSRAYVDARYSPTYEISAEDLVWLVERVKNLQEVVEVICRERLA